MDTPDTGVRVRQLTGSLPMSEMQRTYIDIEKFLGFCVACPRYGQTWSCPPYDFDPADVWNAYNAVRLYAVQVFPESKRAKAAALADAEVFLFPYRKSLDALLESAERETPGSLRLDAGRCRVCETCARRKEKPCRFPEKLRYSLESLGGNVSALAADKLGAPVLWGSREAPPEYFVLVGAVLTKEE